MNREVREIRPFHADRDLGHMLDQAVLVFGNDRCGAGSSIMFEEDPSLFRKQPAVLSWVTEADHHTQFQIELAAAVVKAGIDRSALSLLITARNSYLNRTDVVFEHPLSDLKSLPSSVALDTTPRPAALTTGVHGAVVEAYLLLNRTVGAEPLKPWRRGTWLARASFRIRTKSQTNLFRPIPLKAEHRRRFKLPSQTIRYLRMGDHNPLAPYENQPERPEFYVDSDLLSLLDAQRSSPDAVAVQVQLVCDFAASVIYHSAAQADQLAEKTWEDLEGSLLGRVLRFIIKQSGQQSEQENLLRLARNEPSMVVALAEAAIGVRKVLIKSLRQEGS